MSGKIDPHKLIGDLVLKILENQQQVTPHQKPTGIVDTEHLQRVYTDRARGR